MGRRCHCYYLLHDGCEDCGVTPDELPVTQAVKHFVDLMTLCIMGGETKEIAKNWYYNMLLENREATLCKLNDR